jgi:hypothetical protein
LVLSQRSGGSNGTTIDGNTRIDGTEELMALFKVPVYERRTLKRELG